MSTRDAMPDVVVVGAGMTGTVVTTVLRALGASVVLLDGGPRLATGQKVPEPDRRLWGFKAVGGSYDWYRVRAVGGRSHLWGGWCFRLDDAGLQRAGWPAAARKRLAASYPAVEQLLRVRQGSVDERYVRAAAELGLTVKGKRGAMRAPGAAWNAARTAAGRTARQHVAALRLLTAGRGAAGVLVHDLRTEKPREVRARAVVLAASPLETTRMLLCSGLGPCSAGIGRNFTDHMVCSHVLLEPVPPPPRDGRGPFPGAALIPSFVNVGGDTRQAGYRGGFSVELSGPTHLETLGVERMVASNEVDRWSATQIHVMGEMFPHAERYVDLDPSAVDVLGRPLPRVHVAFSDEDRAMAKDIKQAGVALADALAVPGSRVIPFLDPLTAGAGHEAGTCVMSDDAQAPCRPDGRLRACDNVWIADASVMPTPTDRHPTLTLLAHAHGVAHTVFQALARDRRRR